MLKALLLSIDKFTELTGRLLAWLSVLMMMALCSVVIMRYGFEIGSIRLQESVTYLHASIFMLGSAYTLKHGGHVRVDVFYRKFSRHTQAWINSLGGIIFLLPLCVYIFITSWEFVQQSWQIHEVSTEPDGIPAVFLLKTLIPLMALNLVIQGLAETLRCSFVLINPDK